MDNHNKQQKARSSTHSGKLTVTRGKKQDPARLRAEAIQGLLRRAKARERVIVSPPLSGYIDANFNKLVTHLSWRNTVDKRKACSSILHQRVNPYSTYRLQAGGLVETKKLLFT